MLAHASLSAYHFQPFSVTSRVVRRRSSVRNDLIFFCSSKPVVVEQVNHRDRRVCETERAGTEDFVVVWETKGEWWVS